MLLLLDPAGLHPDDPGESCFAVRANRTFDLHSFVPYIHLITKDGDVQETVAVVARSAPLHLSRRSLRLIANPVRAPFLQAVAIILSHTLVTKGCHTINGLSVGNRL